MGFAAGEEISIHTYAFPYGDRYPERNWKNLILTLPGSDPELSKERVLLVAHLDSTSDQEHTLAPGADDNASGAAGLLEAASVLRHFKFKRTLHLVWFSGEEQSRRGSSILWKITRNGCPNIEGVINLDMFAFDWDDDRCFEVHAGTLPGSVQMGHCLMQVIEIYDLDLTFDFIDDEIGLYLLRSQPLLAGRRAGCDGIRKRVLPGGRNLRKSRPQLRLPYHRRYPGLHQPHNGLFNPASLAGSRGAHGRTSRRLLCQCAYDQQPPGWGKNTS